MKIKIFERNLIIEVNNARQNTSNYIKKLLKHKKFIMKTKELKLFIKTDLNAKAHESSYAYFNNIVSVPTIILINGPEGLNEAAEFLSLINSNFPLLEKDENLRVHFTKSKLLKEKQTETLNTNYIKCCIEKIKGIVLNENQNYHKFNWFYDIGGLNAEITTIIQILTTNIDAKDLRREYIFDSSLNKICISAVRLSKSKVFYCITLAEYVDPNKNLNAN